MSVIITKPSRNYLDVDFIFSMHPITYTIPVKRGVNAVRQSIVNLLTLKTGDKPFHPEIHSPIYDYLFENVSSITQLVIESEIKKYLEVYEPRVIIEEVTVSFPNVNTLTADISGTIINLEEPFTVNILVDRLR